MGAGWLIKIPPAVCLVMLGCFCIVTESVVGSQGQVNKLASSVWVMESRGA